MVTATSPGFDTVKQTIELPANVTVPVDATLKPGAVTDTVTVESRVATVDVENASHNTNLTRSDMDDLPTGRYMQSIASYAPGAHLNLPDIGGSQQVEQNYISIHGNNSTQNSYVFDGMLINTTYSDGAIQNTSKRGHSGNNQSVGRNHGRDFGRRYARQPGSEGRRQ